MALGHFTINFALASKTNLRQAITRFEGWVKILGGVTVASGGVLPNIHSVLLPKKSKKEA